MKTWIVYTILSNGEWKDPRICNSWEKALEVITERCISGGAIAVVIVYY